MTNWGSDYVLGNEIDRSFVLAESDYRRLKQYYNGTGQYDLAGEFHKRELLMRRKLLWEIRGIRLSPRLAKWATRFSAPLVALRSWAARQTSLRRSVEALVLYLSAILMGHGERPSWVLGWVFLTWAGFFSAYLLGNGVPETSWIETMRLSAGLMMSFGPREEVGGWAVNASLVQSFVSYVLLALFLVTFVRKVSPR